MSQNSGEQAIDMEAHTKARLSIEGFASALKRGSSESSAVRSRRPLVVAWVALLLFVPASWRAWARDKALAPSMVGEWKGNARIIVRWCQQKNLAVNLTIRADGAVFGKVGDANLTKGRLKRNRGWVGRKLNIKTDYIIVGGLEGTIVAAEGIARSGVSMPLNFYGETFVGGVHTSGSLFGGKKRMILSASRLTLNRTNSP